MFKRIKSWMKKRARNMIGFYELMDAIHVADTVSEVSERSSAQQAALMDIGRDYHDYEDAPYPHVTFTPADPFPWSNVPVNVVIKKENGELVKGIMYHSHLAMLKLIKEYSFKSVLDVGSGDGNEVAIFKGLTSDVIGCSSDIHTIHKTDFPENYEDVNFDRQFDAVWCSHCLEHVRDPGIFVEKIFHDLKEGGVLALSVPYNDFSAVDDHLIFGHHFRYNTMNLVYLLISAGFDCRKISFRIYNGQISVILRKIQIPLAGKELKIASAYQLERIIEYFPAEVLWNAGCGILSLDRLNW